MTPETFRGADLRTVLEAVRRAYGEDAMIVQTRGPAEAGMYEVTVAPAVRGVSQTLVRNPRADRPYLIALIGPAGAGKTTTAARLAVQLRAERRHVAVLTLDSFKIGALEQMQLFAELIDVPLDYAPDAGEIDALRQRLASFDTIVIDTPGRPSGRGDAAWAPLLAALAPDEVHLVVHAGLRPDLLRRTFRAWSSLSPDHLLPTHVDELAGISELSAVIELLRLPVRWFSAGPELADALQTAHPGESADPRPAMPQPTTVPEHAATLELMLQHARTRP